MENTAKNFALQLGSLISLYVSVSALITLLFGIITVQYPDPAQGYYEYESATSSIRFGIALLIVFFPTYALLTRAVNKIRRTEHGTYLTLTKWLIYLSLLIGGATILADLVSVVLNFLNGEITIRFILKALAFLLVVGTAFTYYLFDARGFWQTNEKASIQYAGVAGFVVLAALISGFMHTETPTQAREMKIDALQIGDLQTMQSHVATYYQLHSKLPISLNDAYEGVEPPIAQEGRGAYVYRVTDSNTFEICADFRNKSSKADQMMYSEPYMADGSLLKNPSNWDHGAGNWCFKRVINTMTLLK